MRHEDFEIDIRSVDGGQFEARVVQAPIHEGPRRLFPPPLSQEALEELQEEAERRVRAASRAPDDAAAAGPDRPPQLSPRQIGSKLFATALGPPIGELFRRCRDTQARTPSTGLRLRLKFQLDDPQAGYLAALPWELLYEAARGRFLATDLATPIVRDLSHPHLQGSLSVDGPLRILVVDAAPARMNELKLQLEIERMQAALYQLIRSGQVELLRPEEATVGAVREALLSEAVHVLHFMGHGGYDTGSGMGAIFFELPGGGAMQVDGEMLGDLLTETGHLRLVNLNSCKTARHAGRAGAPLYFGAASGLVDRTGMPAVVANQYAVSDPAAIAFSEAFYGRLAAGDPVDAAVSEARLRLWLHSSEWGTPVLFLSAADGRIFDLDLSQRSHTVRVAGPRPHREEPPLRLGLRSFVGWGTDMGERTDDLLDLGQHFDGRYIREPSAWQQAVLPEVREFLLERVQEGRPVLLDLAAHLSIAFSAGWVLEAKSGLAVGVRQRVQDEGEFEWHPGDGTAPEGLLWLDRPDKELNSEAPDVAVALSITLPEIAGEVRCYIENTGLPVGRIIDAVIAPEPGQHSVRGGQHALRLAQALANRLRRRRPVERGGRLHIFCAGPNAFMFYLGQLSRSMGRVILYEYPFGESDAYGRYIPSIELPPPSGPDSAPSVR